MHISIPIVFRFLNFCFAGKMRYHPFLFAAESLITLTAIITFHLRSLTRLLQQTCAKCKFITGRTAWLHVQQEFMKYNKFRAFPVISLHTKTKRFMNWPFAKFTLAYQERRNLVVRGVTEALRKNFAVGWRFNNLTGNLKPKLSQSQIDFWLFDFRSCCLNVVHYQ